MNEATQAVSEEVREINLSEKDIARFWSKVNKDGPLPDQSNPHYAGLGPCWIYTGRGRNGSGYGLFGAQGRMLLVHRLSFRLVVGEIPKGEGYHGTCVLHRCDNPICVNPEHFRLGTQQDNEDDKHLKGRAPKGDNHWSRLHPEKAARGDRNGAHTRPERVNRGEDVGNSKLTADQVREIRSSTGSHASTGRRYGVTGELVSLIRKRKVWKHLT